MRWKVEKNISSGDYSVIREFSQFKSIQELDDYVNSFLFFHKEGMKDSTYEVLKCIRSFVSKKLSGIGVCTATLEYLAKKIDRSTRTVSRALQELFELGFIAAPFQTWDKKKNGKRGPGHLVLIIQKVKDIVLNPWEKGAKNDCVNPVVYPVLSTRDDAQMHCESKGEGGNGDDQANIFLSFCSKEFSKQNNSNKVIKNTEIKFTYSKEDVVSYIPSEFVDFIWHEGFKDPNAIKDYYDAAVYSYLKINKIKHWSLLSAEQIDEIVEQAQESFRITKSNKNNLKNKHDCFQKKFGAYYYGVLKKKFKELKKTTALFIPPVYISEYLPREAQATKNELDELGVY